ncbi:MAG: hypothetical protein L6437_07655 [Kiritimatiellae bacterium]|nr:hypothetical protein [Kiritimatiellia bacterium]
MAQKNRRWLLQEDTIARIKAPVDVSSEWFTVHHVDESCFEYISSRFSAIKSRNAKRALEDRKFEEDVFDFFRKAPTRWVARPVYRRFHHLNSDGVRESDRRSFVSVTEHESVGHGFLKCQLYGEQLKEFLHTDDLILLWHLRVCRYTERTPAELNLRFGQQCEENGKDCVYSLFVGQGATPHASRMNTMTNFFGKKIVKI